MVTVAGGDSLQQLLWRRSPDSQQDSPQQRQWTRPALLRGQQEAAGLQRGPLPGRPRNHRHPYCPPHPRPSSHRVPLLQKEIFYSKQSNCLIQHAKHCQSSEVDITSSDRTK